MSIKSRETTIHYGASQWNLSSEKRDQAIILLKDSHSGRIVQITLLESNKDSGLFTGTYLVNWKNTSGTSTNEERIGAEFYVPPQEILGRANGVKELEAMIAAKSLPRKPFLLRRDDRGRQFIELYDTREQALKAVELYKEELRLRAGKPISLQKLKDNESIESQYFITPEQNPLTADEQKKLVRSKAEILRLQQLERSALASKLSEFRMLPEKEREQRTGLAQETSHKGMQLYQSGQYPQSVESFKSARSLNPLERDADLQYGASLYQAQNFTHSTAVLRETVVDPSRDPERQFYLGLNAYQLNDFSEALSRFAVVKKSRDPVLAPSASYYLGLIYARLKRYSEAQAAFQDVLNTSDDAELSNRSEALINQMIQLQTHEHEKAKRWSGVANVGLIYDTNVLLTSDSQRDQGTATDISGIRGLMQGGVSYRPRYTETDEWAVKINGLYLYSVSTDLSSSPGLRKADPFLLNMALPYTRKTNAMGRPYRFQLTPAFETIAMDLDGTGTEIILYSPYLLLNNTLVVKDSWITTLGFETRYDHSLTALATGADDPTAMKYKLNLSNIIFTNKAEGHVLVPEVAYTLNAAKGDNARYYRIDLGLTFVAPWFWGTTWNARAGYYNVNFPETESAGVAARGDQNYSLGTGFSRPFNATTMGIFNLNYSLNNSSREVNRYDKMTALTSVAWSF